MNIVNVTESPNVCKNSPPATLRFVVTDYGVTPFTVMPEPEFESEPQEKSGLGNGGWFPTRNVMVDYYGPIIGPSAYFLYGVLNRRADRKTQRLRAEQKKIAEWSRMSVSTVGRATKVLVKYKLISVSKDRSRGGKWDHNIYQLLEVQKPVDDDYRSNLTSGAHHRSKTTTTIGQIDQLSRLKDFKTKDSGVERRTSSKEEVQKQSQHQHQLQNQNRIPSDKNLEDLKALMPHFYVGEYVGLLWWNDLDPAVFPFTDVEMKQGLAGFRELRRLARTLREAAGKPPFPIDRDEVDEAVQMFQWASEFYSQQTWRHIKTWEHFMTPRTLRGLPWKKDYAKWDEALYQSLDSALSDALEEEEKRKKPAMASSSSSASAQVQ